MKSRNVVVLLMLVSLVSLVSANLAINPNFELDASGAVNLLERPFSDCLGWGGWGPDTRVVAHDKWGGPHAAALMAARIGPNNNNSVWLDTGVVMQADTVYTFSADIKSEWSWQMGLQFKAKGTNIKQEQWFTPQHHADWKNYETTLDTAVETDFVGEMLVIEIFCHDWDWGHIYATNVELVPEPATMLMLGVGSIAVVRKKRK